jgi:hypothetical protein
LGNVPKAMLCDVLVTPVLFSNTTDENGGRVTLPVYSLLVAST